MGGQAQANLITNGSFEDPGGVFTNNGSGFETLGPGSTKIPGWTVGGAGVDWILGPAGGPGLWDASDGSFSIDLSPVRAGSVASTSFATTISVPILVTFDLSGNPAGPPDTKIMDLLVNGVLDSSFSYDMDANGNTFADMLYSPESFVFTPTTTTTTLTFSSATSTAYGPALDNVAANPIPEPASMLLLGSGLVGLAGFRRKNKK